MISRSIPAALLMQVRVTRRRIEDLFPVLTYTLSASVVLVILVHSGRGDLVGHALVAALLMSIGQMSFFVGSEILANERQKQILEAIAATPTNYFVPLLTRITVHASLLGEGCPKPEEVV